MEEPSAAPVTETHADEAVEESGLVDDDTKAPAEVDEVEEEPFSPIGDHAFPTDLVHAAVGAVAVSTHAFEVQPSEAEAVRVDGQLSDADLIPTVESEEEEEDQEEDDEDLPPTAISRGYAFPGELACVCGR